MILYPIYSNYGNTKSTHLRKIWITSSMERLASTPTQARAAIG